MKNIMNKLKLILISKLLGLIFFSFLLTACDNKALDEHGSHNDGHGHGSDEAVEHVKGIHGGNVLTSGDFSLELGIAEAGMDPEFHAWASFNGQPLQASDIQLKVVLNRLSSNENDRSETINFVVDGDFLRGNRVVYEPHSFVVSIDAKYKGENYHWQYDSFEGRTNIKRDVADALAIKSLIAGPVVLQKTIDVYGKIKTNTEQLRKVSARFSGVIKSVSISVGEIVKKGQVLATVESNESFKLYTIKSPINGVVTQRNASAGEQTGSKNLFEIADTSSVWVDLSIYPMHQSLVKSGDVVKFTVTGKNEVFEGKISMINVLAENNQSLTARLVFNNKNSQLLPGSFISAKIKIDEVSVPLAVKRNALQSFRDFTVVYAQVGEDYEVRMVELGQRDAEWVEVLSGLKAGTVYVSENSYVIKADIEKAGAAHDH